eukprot:SAG11_NODE_20275_length_449_cov_0.734286_2_plen_58_part_01
MSNCVNVESFNGVKSVPVGGEHDHDALGGCDIVAESETKGEGYLLMTTASNLSLHWSA